MRVALREKYARTLVKETYGMALTIVAAEVAVTSHRLIVQRRLEFKRGLAGVCHASSTVPMVELGVRVTWMAYSVRPVHDGLAIDQEGGKLRGQRRGVDPPPLSMRCGHCQRQPQDGGGSKSLARIDQGAIRGLPTEDRDEAQVAKGPENATIRPPGICYRRQMREVERAEREDKDYTLNSPLDRAAAERAEEERARDRSLEPRGPIGHILYFEQGPDTSHRGSRTHSQTWVGACECGWSKRAGSVEALRALHASHCATDA